MVFYKREHISLRLRLYSNKNIRKTGWIITITHSTAVGQFITYPFSYFPLATIKIGSDGIQSGKMQVHTDLLFDVQGSFVNNIHFHVICC
ncbi:hypothetical protein GDO86_015038 [Hymenochirus boettgeri]|uniref:Uncharacterized protein n=1 Tax=Hymenochirus boettgeri TaxID=247094 RepID=A0A8T2JTX0_9PIPI|nr:hypothetical protein GDO86_015038 [Hymenochirus boettgeri]